LFNLSEEYERVDEEFESVGEEFEKVTEEEFEKVSEDTEVVEDDVEVVAKPSLQYTLSRNELEKALHYEFCKANMYVKYFREKVYQLQEDIARAKFTLKYDITKMRGLLRKLKRELKVVKRYRMRIAERICYYICEKKCNAKVRIYIDNSNSNKAYYKAKPPLEYCKKNCIFYEARKLVIQSAIQKALHPKRIKKWYGVRSGGYRRKPRSPFRRI